MMQVAVIQEDRDWLGVGDPKMGRATIRFSTARVAPARIGTRHAWGSMKPIIVHVLDDPVRDRYGNKKAKAVCGVDVREDHAFQIHERPLAFRERLSLKDPPPIGGRPSARWMRLCARCAR